VEDNENRVKIWAIRINIAGIIATDDSDIATGWLSLLGCDDENWEQLDIGSIWKCGCLD
jgi:hypothetical protein